MANDAALNAALQRARLTAPRKCPEAWISPVGPCAQRSDVAGSGREPPGQARTSTSASATCWLHRSREEEEEETAPARSCKAAAPSTLLSSHARFLVQVYPLKQILPHHRTTQTHRLPSIPRNIPHISWDPTLDTSKHPNHSPELTRTTYPRALYHPTARDFYPGTITRQQTSFTSVACG